MMNSSRTATKTMTGTPRHLQKSRSAEDLSREQLKSTEKDTVLIFIEYVRKKVWNYSLRAAEVDEERDAERRQRERRLYQPRSWRTLCLYNMLAMHGSFV